MRTHNCKACSFARRGIKTRKEIEHTCDEGTSPSYQHKDLMWDVNDLFARVKWHLSPPIAVRGGPIRPTAKDIDDLMDRILEALSQ